MSKLNPCRIITGFCKRRCWAKWWGGGKSSSESKPRGSPPPRQLWDAKQDPVPVPAPDPSPVCWLGPRGRDPRQPWPPTVLASPGPAPPGFRGFGPKLLPRPRLGNGKPAARHGGPGDGGRAPGGSPSPWHGRALHPSQTGPPAPHPHPPRGFAMENPSPPSPAQARRWGFAVCGGLYFSHALFQATSGCGYQSQMLQVLVSNENQLTTDVFVLRNQFWKQLAQLHALQYTLQKKKLS